MADAKESTNVPPAIEAKMLIAKSIENLIQIEGKGYNKADAAGKLRIQQLQTELLDQFKSIISELGTYQSQSDLNELRGKSLSNDYIYLDLTNQLPDDIDSTGILNYSLGDRGQSSVAAYNALPTNVKVKYAKYLKTPVNPVAAAVNFLIPGGPSIGGGIQPWIINDPRWRRNPRWIPSPTHLRSRSHFIKI